jgi:hypothetical protein
MLAFQCDSRLESLSMCTPARFSISPGRCAPAFRGPFLVMGSSPLVFVPSNPAGHYPQIETARNVDK